MVLYTAWLRPCGRAGGRAVSVSWRRTCSNIDRCCVSEVVVECARARVNDRWRCNTDKTKPVGSSEFSFIQMQVNARVHSAVSLHLTSTHLTGFTPHSPSSLSTERRRSPASEIPWCHSFHSVKLQRVHWLLQQAAALYDSYTSDWPLSRTCTSSARRCRRFSCTNTVTFYPSESLRKTMR